MSTLFTQFRLKRRTAAEWATAATLAQGEPGFESDTGRLKIGTGSASWAALPYVSNVRTGTASSLSGLVLGNGEVGYETDTRIMKVGNASTAWASLPSTINVRTNDTTGWGASSLVLGNGEIGYETTTGAMKVGNGSAGWSALPYLTSIVSSDMSPLLMSSTPALTSTSAGAVGWGRRITPGPYTIHQVEFWPNVQWSEPNGVTQNIGRVDVYNSASVDNTNGTIQTSSFPITLTQWNAAATAGQSIKATLQTPFKADNKSYIFVYRVLAGHPTSSVATATLSGVTISGTNISWTSATGPGTISNPSFSITTFTGSGVPVGLVVTSFTTYNSTGGNRTFSATTPVSPPLSFASVSVMPLSVPFRRSNDPAYITLASTAGYLKGGNIIIAGAGTPTAASGNTLATDNNKTFTIQDVNSSTNTITVFNENAVPFLGTGATAKPSTTGATTNVISIYTPGTIRIDLASTVGISVGTNVSITGAATGNNITGYPVTSITGNSITLINMTGVSQSISGTLTGGTNPTLIQSITSLADMTVDPSRWTIAGYGQGPTLTAGAPRVHSTAAYIKLYTYETISTGGAAVDSTAIVTSALSQVSTVTSIDASERVNGKCDILLPSKLRLLKRTGEEYSIYNRHLITGNWANAGVVDYAITPYKKEYGAQFNECVQFTGNGLATGLPLFTLSGIVRDYMWNTTKEISTSVNVTDMSLSGAVRYLSIGDSITRRSQYQKRVMDLAYVSSPISSISVMGTTVTVNVTDNRGFNTGDSVRIVGSSASGTDLTFPIATLIGTTQFTFISSGVSSVGPGGIAVVGAIASSRINSCSISGGVLTVTVASVTGFTVGNSVTIYGVSPANNVSARIETVSGSTFTIKHEGGQNTDATGSAIAGSIITVGTRYDISNAADPNVSMSYSAESSSGTNNTGYAIEGRGGWLVLSYVLNTAESRSDGFASPFMFPTTLSGATYRGSTEFWKRAMVLDSTATCIVTVSGDLPGITVGTSISISGAVGRNNITTAVVNTIGTNAFTIRNTGAFDAGAVGTVTYGSTTRNIANITVPSGYDYAGFGRAAREGATSSYAYDTSGYPTNPSNGWRVYDQNILPDTRNIASITASGSNAIITVTGGVAGFFNGLSVTISGATSGNNVTAAVTNVNTGLNQITIVNASAANQVSAAGTVTFANRWRQWSSASGAWIVDPTVYTWAFDYSKYLERYSWAFPSNPTHVSILLAANDFNATEGADPINFTSSWIPNYRTMVNSIRSVSGTKVIVLLPTMASLQDGYGNLYGLGELAERARRNFQGASRALINEFDTSTYEGQNVFVCLFGAGSDPIYASRLTATIAPNKYITDNTLFIRRSIDGIHPEVAGMYQSGDWLAATIQHTR